MKTDLRQRAHPKRPHSKTQALGRLATGLGSWLLCATSVAGSTGAGYYPLEQLSGVISGQTVEVGSDCEGVSRSRTIRSTQVQFSSAPDPAGQPYLLLAENGTATIRLASHADFQESESGPQVPNAPIDARLLLLTRGNGSWTNQGGQLVLDLTLTHEFERIFCFNRQGVCDEDWLIPDSGTFNTTLPPTLLQPGGAGPRLSTSLDTLGLNELGWREFFSFSASSYSDECVSGAVGNAYQERPLALNFGPAGQGGLEANFGGVWLEEVLAPYGFKVDGDWTPGNTSTEARFIYGSEQVSVALDSGFAEAPDLDYGADPDSISAEIVIDGSVTEVLELELERAPIPDWAGPCQSPALGVCPASAFRSAPGVSYRADLAWPVSLEATEVLQNASLLTGLFGITGSAESDFDLGLHSDGRPTAGALDTRIAVKVGKRELALGLAGTHSAELSTAGGALQGDLVTTRARLDFDKRVGLVDLIPGASAALAALPPKLNDFLTGGAGIAVAGGIDAGGAGEYGAGPADDRLRFTSGALDIGVDLQAQLSVFPDFLRGLIRLALGGGGEVDAIVDLFPDTEVRQISGLLRFFFDLKILNLSLVQADQEWPIGSQGTTSTETRTASLLGERNATLLEANQAPAQSDVAMGALRRGTAQRSLAVFSEPHPSLPAPATRIVMSSESSSGTWSRALPGADDGRVRFSPSYGQPDQIGGQDNRGVLVWSEATGTAPNPGDIAGMEGFLNTTELRYTLVTLNSSLQPAFSPSFGPFRELTNNALADYGPSLVPAENGGRLRLFWVRGDGLDLTGSNTPLQLLSRELETFNTGAAPNNPDAIWTAELALGGPHFDVLDWQAAVWDNDNAAVVIVRDMDGDYLSVDDTELWLIRQQAGSWLPPRRLTNNAVADDAPLIHFIAADQLLIGWRRGETVVGTFDADGFDEGLAPPELWFDGDTRVAENWPRARITRRPYVDSLVLAWPSDDGIAYIDQDWGTPAPGSVWPVPRHLPLGTGTISAFDFAFRRQFEGQSVARVIHASEPRTLDALTGISDQPAALAGFDLFFGEGLGEGIQNLWGQATVNGERFDSLLALASAPIPAGSTIELRARAVAPTPIRYQWYRDDQLIPGATGAILRLPDVSYADSGRYAVLGQTDTQTIELYALALEIGQIDYAGYLAAKGLDPADFSPFEDTDGDSVINLHEYLAGSNPADPEDRPDYRIALDSPTDGYCVASLPFSRRAGDIGWRLEYSTDGETWVHFDSPADPLPLAGGIELALEALAYAPDSPLASSMPVLPNGEAHLRLRIDELRIPGFEDSCSETQLCVVTEFSCPSEQAALMKLTAQALSGVPYQAEGDLIRYRLALDNVGTAALSGVDVDAWWPEPVAIHCLSPLPAILAPDQTLECEASYIVTEDDLFFSPIEFEFAARAQGADETELSIQLGVAAARYESGPLIRLDKSAELLDLNGNGLGDPGEMIVYTLIAENLGDQSVDEVVITDPLIETLVCEPSQPASLAPGETLTCTSQLMIENGLGSALLNTAWVSAPDPLDPSITLRAGDNALVPLISEVTDAIFQDRFEASGD